MTTKLDLYNGALIAADSRLIASLTEDRESRRKLDVIWDQGAVEHCLRQGYWKFAMRSVKLEEDPNTSPGFGYAYGFLLPSDYYRSYMVSVDPYFRRPFLDYQIEQGMIFAGYNEIYIRYTSSTIGNDMTKWPADFTQMVIHYLAWRMAPSLKSDISADKLNAMYELAKREAKGNDAMETPSTFKPEGSWNRSRRSRAGQVNRHG